MYDGQRQDVAALIEFLQLELQKHAEYAEVEGIDYGACGDLGYVRGKLIEVLSQLAQRDEEDIWDTLDDMAAGREQAAARNTD